MSEECPQTGYTNIAVISGSTVSDSKPNAETNMDDVKGKTESGDAEDQPGTVGLIDGKQNYRRKPTPKTERNCCLSRIWLILTVFFLITTVAAVAVLVWREFNACKRNEETPLTKYPEFFRTPEEQEKYAQLVYQTELQNIIYVNETIRANTSCIMRCHPREFGQRKRGVKANLQFHGCCVSETSFVSPDYLPNLFGHIKKIAQYKGKKQFFMEQKCRQVEKCNGCKCAQTYTFVSAVVEEEGDDDDKYFIDRVRVKGCCKCLNNSPAPNGRRKRSSVFH